MHQLAPSDWNLTFSQTVRTCFINIVNLAKFFLYLYTLYFVLQIT